MRNIKGTFSITGRSRDKPYGEDHEAPDIEPVNRKVKLNAIDRRLKEKGIDAFDLQLVKVKELDVDELYPPVETDTVADPPFGRDMTQNEAMERAKERWNANLLSDDRVKMNSTKRTSQGRS